MGQYYRLPIPHAKKHNSIYITLVHINFFNKIIVNNISHSYICLEELNLGVRNYDHSSKPIKISSNLQLHIFNYF